MLLPGLSRLGSVPVVLPLRLRDLTDGVSMDVRGMSMLGLRRVCAGGRVVDLDFKEGGVYEGGVLVDDNGEGGSFVGWCICEE